MSSNNSGRKRGRPVTLTPEQRFANEKERWRRKKARQRKEAQDAKWQRQTNFGYFVQLWVPHYNRLIEALVGKGYLHEDDTDIPPRVDAAADEVFAAIGYHWPNAAIDYHWLLDKGRARPFGVGTPGTVRVRMTQELASWLAEDEYSRRFSPTDLRWADEDVKYLRESYLKERALAAREQRKPLFLRVPPFGCRDYAERLAKCLNHIREAEARRDEVRRSFRAPEEFKEEFLQNRKALTHAAERYLTIYAAYIPKRSPRPLPGVRLHFEVQTKAGDRDTEGATQAEAASRR